MVINERAKDDCYNAFKKMVAEGIELIKSNATDNKFEIWIKYSDQIVEIAGGCYDPTISLNYLWLRFELQKNDNISLKKQVSAYIQYLLECLECMNKM